MECPHHFSVSFSLHQSSVTSVWRLKDTTSVWWWDQRPKSPANWSGRRRTSPSWAEPPNPSSPSAPNSTKWSTRFWEMRSAWSVRSEMLNPDTRSRRGCWTTCRKTSERLGEPKNWVRSTGKRLEISSMRPHCSLESHCELTLSLNVSYSKYDFIMINPEQKTLFYSKSGKLQCCSSKYTVDKHNSSTNIQYTKNNIRIIL